MVFSQVFRTSAFLTSNFNFIIFMLIFMLTKSGPLNPMVFPMVLLHRAVWLPTWGHLRPSYFHLLFWRCGPRRACFYGFSYVFVTPASYLQLQFHIRCCSISSLLAWCYLVGGVVSAHVGIHRRRCSSVFMHTRIYMCTRTGVEIHLVSFTVLARWWLRRELFSGRRP